MEIELPVEILECFERAKLRGLGASCQRALVSYVEFVLEDEFEELPVAETPGGSLLQAQLQTLHQAGETELAHGMELELAGMGAGWMW